MNGPTKLFFAGLAGIYSALFLYVVFKIVYLAL